MGFGAAPGPVRGVGAHCAVGFCAARRGGPISLEKWGKEHQGGGVSSPLDPPSLVGLALRAVP